jgi:bifunctional enzyme CysN/CysC
MAAATSIPSEQLKIVIVGHVDHGKSTFVGRLFHDTGSLPEGKLEQLQKVAERRGVPFEWANLMDALQSERDQNITIDTAQIWFHTKKRQYVIIDAPGHKEFLKNMVTGAANAEAALLLIDAHEGVQENSRRHGYLLNLLGIRQIAVLVNKMDLENFSQARFDQIEKEYRAYLIQIGVEPKLFIPIAAKHGDNIASPSSNMSWWQGPTVLKALDEFKVSDLPKDQPLRFPIQDVYRFDQRRILAGRVESGTLKVGDRLIFSPNNKVSAVHSIERWNAPAADVASAGESIGITLAEQIFVERGAVAALETQPPYELTRFKARLFWLGRTPFRAGKFYKLKLATQEVECEIDTIARVIDASTLETVRRPGSAGPSTLHSTATEGGRAPVGGPPARLGSSPTIVASGSPTGLDGGQQPAPPEGVEFVGRHEVAELYLRTKRPIAFDAHSEIIATGRFVIVDGFDVSGGGIIVEDNYPRRTSDSLHKSQDIYWSQGRVTAGQRARRNGHPGCVVWLTGLSGAGKSTIATELERELFNLGKHAYVLDGDKIRHGLCSDLAFSPPDRKENIRRVGELAKLFADAGMICITAFISPYRSDRETVRNMVNAGQFIEVYVNAPIEVCEQRDPKGLYAKARAHEIKEFTGVSAPYEAPEKPEIELRTDKLSVQESVAGILEYLHVEEIDSGISI